MNLEFCRRDVVRCAPMLTARPAAAPVLYAGGEFDPEFARVLRIGNPGAALRRALTFSPGLASGAAARSTLAGKRLLRQLSGARGERLLTKLQVQSDAGSLPTHFLTIYATQSALFHLSLRLLLPGFAYWEWAAAMQACPPLGQPTPDFAQAAPGLQGTVQTTFSSHAFHAVQPFAAAGAS